MKKTLIVSILISLMTVSPSVVSYAQMEGHGMMGESKKGHKKGSYDRGHHGGHFGLEHMKKSLDLSSDQEAQMRKLRLAYEKTMVQGKADIKIGKLDLFELLEQDPLDLPSIQAKLREINSLRADLAFQRMKLLKEAGEFLNKKQYSKFKDYTLKKMREKMHDRDRHGSSHSRRGDHHGRYGP